MNDDTRRSWIHPNIEIKSSKLGGKGMFATKYIAQEEKALVWSGVYVNNEGSKLVRQDGKLVLQ